MQILNPFLMNDWPIKKFLLVVLAFQLAFLGSLFIEPFGLRIPLLREVISLVVLLYVPGILILRILKKHELCSVETMLYSVGLSIAFLMCTGLVMNTVYPAFGVSHPISLMPLAVTFNALISMLCMVTYLRDYDFSNPVNISARVFFSPQALFLYLLPLFSALGTSLINGYQNNIVLMVLIAVIALVGVSIGFKKLFPAKLYPLVVFSIGLSLLFFRSLISNYISGFDIHDEYFFANMVQANNIWDSGIPNAYNSLPSIVMLGPITSFISGISLVWIFKVVYPILFALVPVGLYRIFQKQINSNLAFLAILFFMSVSEFFLEEAILPRQQIATIFVVALILVHLDKSKAATHLSPLLIIFGFSLVLSHYGLALIFTVFLGGAWLLLALWEKYIDRQAGSSTSVLSRMYDRPLSLINEDFGKIKFVFVAFLFTFSFVWYAYTSIIFSDYVGVGNRIVSHLSDFLNPAYSQGLTLLLSRPKPGILHQIYAFISYATQVLIVVGVLIILLKHKRMRFKREFIAFLVLGLALVFAGILLPFLSKEVNMARLYHIGLIFLSPAFVIGAVTLIKKGGRILGSRFTKTNNSLYGRFISLYLAIFLLFQTGFIWQITRDHTSLSVSLSTTIDKDNVTPDQIAGYYSAVTKKQDVYGAIWLSKTRTRNFKIYAWFTDIRVHALRSYGSIEPEDMKAFTMDAYLVPQGNYIFAQYLNVTEGLGSEFYGTNIYGQKFVVYNMDEIPRLFEGHGKVYSNGGTEIYW